MTCLHEQMVANCASELHLCRRWNCASALHLCRRWNGGTTHHWVYSTRLRTWSSLPASLLARCCVRGMCTRDTGSRPEIMFCSRLTWYSCTARSTSSELTTGVVHSLWLAVPSLLWHCWLDVGRSMRPVKKLSDEVLVRLSVWSEVQIACIWSSWCHCIPKAHNLLPHLSPDWFYLCGTGLPRLSWKRGRWTDVVVAVLMLFTEWLALFANIFLKKGIWFFSACSLPILIYELTN